MKIFKVIYQQIRQDVYAETRSEARTKFLKRYGKLWKQDEGNIMIIERKNTSV